MKIVNSETARKLKGAGFPQPKKEFGQIWYNNDSQPLFIIPDNNTLLFVILHNIDKKYFRIYFDDLIFAPSATDILREMPGVSLFFNETAFGCRWTESETPFVMLNKNEAELCAAVWLDINPI